MIKQQRPCDRLFLLVGSNSFPNYLTSLILKPRSIILFYSSETEKIKDNLKDGLKEKLADSSIDEICVRKATVATETYKVFHEAFRKTFHETSRAANIHLNYTGGTKIMAANARMAFKDAGGEDKQASYLDERKGILRFDDDYEIKLSTESFELKLDDILKLHGIKKRAKEKTPFSSIFKDAGRISELELADKILKLVCNEPKYAKELYDNCQEASAINLGKELKKLLDTDLSTVCFTEDGWSKDIRKKVAAFFKGGWLEIWCSELLRGMLKGNEVSVSVNCIRANDRSFEIDLAVIYEHRLYVISCTTASDLKLCKSKLFEVAIRARQLGGDLARSALVCLCHGSDSNGSYAGQLRKDIEDIWDASNTPQVFNLDDLKDWEGYSGKRNTKLLKDWIASDSAITR